MAAAAIPEDATLYELNLSLILPNQLTRALSDLSGGVWSEKILESLSGNLRNRIFILSAPIESWGEYDNPPVYAALQLSLEGSISSFPPSQEDETEQIRYYFQFVPPIPRDRMIGAKITHVFAREEQFVAVTIKHLAQYYGRLIDQSLVGSQDGTPVLVRGRQPLKVHYLAAFSNPVLADVQLWEDRGLLLFIMGQHWELQSNRRVRCLMVKMLGDYTTDVVKKNEDCNLHDVFMRHCKSIICQTYHCWDDNIDILVIKRMLNHYLELVKKDNSGVTRRTVRFDEKRITRLLETTRRPSGYAFDMDIKSEMGNLVQAYFLGELPIQLKKVEESLVIMTGIQNFSFRKAGERLKFDEKRIFELVQALFKKVMVYLETAKDE